jgi:hypothetical protein
MSNLYRGPSRDASFQILIHLAKRFRGEDFFRNQSRSAIKIAHFVPISYQTWPPQVILVSDWLISKLSSAKR